ncbi:dipeptidase [Oceanobacillus manasiensis]|uniref:dipeptidase n=1 Tax=Oceanobacillus manasiensis TaxID=586413 RepID=UPI0006943A0B|nr:dipeptidase [Oceanobacillus manasiensis]
MNMKLFYIILSIFLVLPNSRALLSEVKGGKGMMGSNTADIIVDGHQDTMYQSIDSETWLPTTDIGQETNFEVDIPKLQKGGLNVPFFAAYTPGFYGNDARSISHTLAQISALYWTEENNSEQLQIVSRAPDILATANRGKIAAVPTIEGAYSLNEENALELTRQYNDLGITTMGFTWNYSNALGEGADQIFDDQAKTASSGGLTELGAKVVKEMNKLGMAVDVSHMAESTFWDVVETTEAPVIATHSGVKALKDHQRNLTDEQLVALKENGGVIGIVFYPEFLTNSGEATISDIVDHIDHAVNIMGVNHVAIGSDFDGAELPSDLNDSSEIGKIKEALTERGYSEEEVSKIMGLNTLRVLNEIQGAADQINRAQGLSIIPEVEMGENLIERTPTLTAELKVEEGTELDMESLEVIVDGIPNPATYDKETATISFTPIESLKEKFHVVTFLAADKEGNEQRETRIFRVE